MPGLLRGVARTAVVAGTATAVSNRVSRRQAKRWGYMDEPEQAGGYEEPPPPAPAEPAADPIAQLRQLAELKDQGILTEEEFAAQKARILGT
jgi:hypothetical protein